MKKARIALLALCLITPLLSQAQSANASPESIGENLLRLEGTDQPSGIHYLKLIVLLNPTNATAPETLPRFTIECREQAGKRSLHWLLRFDGSPDFAFQHPNVSTKENLYPIPNPSVDLKMRFEGYMQSKDFKRQWEILPTGELHYRNPGLGSSNMDNPRYFLQWLNSLPNLRIVYAKTTANTARELVFPLQPALAQLAKSNLCQP